jgi:hypothetical protein
MDIVVGDETILTVRLYGLSNVRKLVVPDNYMIESKTNMERTTGPHLKERCIGRGGGSAVKIETFNYVMIPSDLNGVAILVALISIGKTWRSATSIRTNRDGIVSGSISSDRGATYVTPVSFEIDMVPRLEDHAGNFLERFPGAVFSSSAMTIISAYTIYIERSHIICRLRRCFRFLSAFKFHGLAGCQE